MTLHISLGYERIDEVQTVGRVGDRVAAGVAHLVFLSVFFDVFDLVGQSCLEVVTACLMSAYEFETHHIGCQVIAGMFHIGTNTEIVLRLCVVEPILPHDIIGLFLLRVEGGCHEFYAGRIAELTGDTNGAEEGAEQILFLAVEIDLKRLDICQCAETCLAVFGVEIIVVV